MSDTTIQNESAGLATAPAEDDHHAPTYEEGPPHPYHMVDPSVWPILGAFAGGLFAVGTVMFMHDGPWWVMVLGLLSILGVMFGWWRRVIIESVVQNAHSIVTKIGLRYGMMLFISSEVMFFVAFFWAFFNASLFPMEATGFVWPPEGIVTFDPFHLPFLMTLVLLLSGCTVTWAHHALREGHNGEAARALGLTVLLGFLFSCLQVYEYSHAAFGFRDEIGKAAP